MPAFENEWYPRNMYLKDSRAYDHHVETYGPQTTFGYKDFIPQFTARQFDPDAWASLFKEAGAKYVVPVAEHHDGFAMYDCSFTRWNSVRMGPQRDVLGELAAAVRRQGLVFGASYHRAEHWWFFNGGRDVASDVQDPRYDDLYGPAQQRPATNPPDKAFLDDWMARLVELVERYEPQLVYFDWWIEQPAFRPYLSRFAAYYYNRAAQWNRGAVINYKQGELEGETFAEGSAVYDIERGQMSTISSRFWQSDTSIMRNSWCDVSSPDYKPVNELIGDLVDVVSKNGALLLNIGPRADGSIPDEAAERLRAIGRWLGVNGEAIYASRPWRVFGEGPTESAAVIHGVYGDVKRTRVHREGHSLHHPGGDALRHIPRLAGERHSRYHVAPGERGSAPGSYHACGAVGLGGAPHLGAGRGSPPGGTACVRAPPASGRAEDHPVRESADVKE